MASRLMASKSSWGVQRAPRSGERAERRALMVPVGSPDRSALPEASRSRTAIMGLSPKTARPVAA